jgi:hypothetical protein
MGYFGNSNANYNLNEDELKKPRDMTPEDSNYISERL